MNNLYNRFSVCCYNKIYNMGLWIKSKVEGGVLAYDHVDFNLCNYKDMWALTMWSRAPMSFLPRPPSKNVVSDFEIWTLGLLGLLLWRESCPGEYWMGLEIPVIFDWIWLLYGVWWSTAEFWILFVTSGS